MGNPLPSVLRTVLIVAAAFFLTSLLFKPGYIDLTAPAHSDLYRYFLIAEAPWVASTWLTPRPLMIAYLKLAGVFHSPGSLYVLLALPSMAFIVMLALIGSRISTVPISGLSIFLFGVTAFGMPHFLPMFQYDYGGMLSGFLAASAIYLVLPRAERPVDGRTWAWAMLLVWASLETKPTYGLALLGVSAVATLLTRRRAYLLATLGVAFILGAVFVKDVLLGSGFIQSASTNNVYSVVIDIPRNIQALGFYVKNALTFPMQLAVAICALALLAARQWKLLLFIVVAAVGSSAPMALLVNRLWDIYAWFSTAIFAMLILLGSAILQQQAARARAVGAVMAYLLVAAVSGLLLVSAGSGSAAAEWASNNQRYNRHMLDMLSALEPQGSGRIIFAGARGPYHPLRNTEYIKRVFPAIHSFDILARRSEMSWNKMAARELVNAVYPSELNLRGYSRVYVLSEAGSLAGVYTPADLLAMPPGERSRVLLCSEATGSRVVSNEAQLLKALDCLVSAEEFKDAIALWEEYAGLDHAQPWIFFQLAKAYGSVGSTDLALAAINRALAIEPKNPIFENMRKQVEK
ncbi:MAG: tetratricopeptide repeat protein [Achromobacter sp.]|uniref:tetratricopeptide repeat protein n=1 Tax=Achromobacter sp. TaxID=134375 RepID=UPI003CFE0A37